MFHNINKHKSGRQDSNLRPSGPKPDALPPAPLPELVVLGQP